MEDSSSSSSQASSIDDTKRSSGKHGKQRKRTAKTSSRKLPSASRKDENLQRKLAATVGACRTELGEDFDIFYVSSSKRDTQGRADTPAGPTSSQGSAVETTQSRLSHVTDSSTETCLPIPCPKWLRGFGKSSSSTREKTHGTRKHGNATGKVTKKTDTDELAAMRKQIQAMEKDLKDCSHFIAEVMKLAQGTVNEPFEAIQQAATASSTSTLSWASVQGASSTEEEQNVRAEMILEQRERHGHDAGLRRTHGGGGASLSAGQTNQMHLLRLPAGTSPEDVFGLVSYFYPVRNVATTISADGSVAARVSLACSVPAQKLHQHIDAALRSSGFPETIMYVFEEK